MIEESLLDRVALFRGLNPEARRELAARSVVLTKRPGQVLWRAGDPARGLVILLTGSVRLVAAATRRPPRWRRQPPPSSSRPPLSKPPWRPTPLWRARCWWASPAGYADWSAAWKTW